MEYGDACKNAGHDEISWKLGFANNAMPWWAFLNCIILVHMYAMTVICVIVGTLDMWSATVRICHAKFVAHEKFTAVEPSPAIMG